MFQCCNSVIPQGLHGESGEYRLGSTFYSLNKSMIHICVDSPNSMKDWEQEEIKICEEMHLRLHYGHDSVQIPNEESPRS